MDTAITYKIPTYHETEALNRIRAANRRLERAGIKVRFEYLLDHEVEVVTHPVTKKSVEKKHTLLTLNRPMISYDGWEFVARIDTLESGKLIAMAAPGQELQGFTPTSLTCEQCETNRARKHVYVVCRDNEFKVVGSTCLELFLGVKPGGLWVLEWDDIEELSGGEFDFARAHAPVVVPSDTILATAAAVVQITGGYRPASFDDSTTSTVASVLFTEPRREEEARFNALVRDSAEEVDVGALRGELSQALAGSDSEWAEKVLMLMNEEWVAEHHAGLLASGISAIEKYRAKKLERQAIASGFLGEKGETVQDIHARVILVRSYETHYGYYGGISEVIVMQSIDSGHRFTWRTSRATDVEQGDELLITKAKVKGHETKRGYDETLIFYTKYEHIERDEVAAA